MLTDRKQFLLLCGATFVLALGVRFLTWQDNHREIPKVQSSVTGGYKESAWQLANGDFKTFVSDPNQLGHPPGYSIILAAIFKVAGESNTTIQIVQIFCDALAVVLLVIIGLELVSPPVALIAGLLAAISPQFAYFSVLLLPDSLVVLPILASVYFLIRGWHSARLLHFFIAGAFVGLSCWVRANSLLLPFFMAATAALLVHRLKRAQAAAAVVTGAVLLIAPITIKNAIVYRHFIPLSLGTGQTFVEGIADYDTANRFNMPNTDLGLMRQEAEQYGKPEYAQLLFGPDGIERDRMRIARGLDVVTTHPFWFTGVVMRRGVASTRLDPVPVLARESPVSHDLAGTGAPPVWTRDLWRPDLHRELLDRKLRDTTEIINIKPGSDYVFHLPLKLEEGRVFVKVTNADGGKVLSSTCVDLVEGLPANDQPVQNLALPFISGSETQVRLALTSRPWEKPVVVIGPSRLLELGPSSHQWMRYVRIPLGWMQRIFTTAVFVPLVGIGLILMMSRKTDWRTLAIILTVPAYYLIVQSTLHTERRYVYVIHFFFLLAAATTVWSLLSLLRDAKTGNTKG